MKEYIPPPVFGPGNNDYGRGRKNKKLIDEMMKILDEKLEKCEKK